MVSIANDAMNALRRAHTERAGDVDLGQFLVRFPDLGDDELADLIELDARERLRAGLPVELPRYLETIPNLATRRVALDAAIEFALRSLSGSRHTKIEAVEALCAAYPNLVPAISAAWFLNDALGSTTGASLLVQPPIDLKLPASIGPVLPTSKQRYELRQRVGVGSHGSVYIAVDQALSESDLPAWVAVKITSIPAGSHALAHRLRDEATKARRVTHPNVARVLDRGTLDNGGEFIVYEHVDGGDLQAAHERGRLPRSPRALASLVARISRAVQAAHAAGLIHSDLKPSNILLTSAGEPKVADFGLAARRFDLAAEGGGIQLGTLGFMAPERYRAEPGSEGVPSDIYALGGILYFLLTGRPPNGANTDEVADRLGAEGPGREVEFPEPTAGERVIDRDLQEICLKALASRPQERYASADAFANDLDDWLAHRPLAWRKPTPGHVLKLFFRRNPAVCIGGAVLVLGSIGATAGMMQVKHEADTRLMQVQLDNNKERASADLVNRQNAKAMSASMIETIMAQRRNLDPDWLMMLTILESVTGPAILESSGTESFQSLWQARVETARELVEEARKNGHANDSQAVLWRLALGYWLLRDVKSYEEAREILSGAAKDWAARWGGSDSLSLATGALAACAEIRKYGAAAEKGRLDGESLARVLACTDVVIGALDGLNGIPGSRNFKRECQEALALAFSSKLLNDPAKQVRFLRVARDE